MSDSLPRPPFDPELGAFLARLAPDGPMRLTTEKLAAMRRPEQTDEQVDEALSAKGWQRRDHRIPGHRGDEITVSVLSRVGRSGAAPCFYSIHGGGWSMGSRLGNLDSFDEWLFVHDVVLVTIDYRLAPEFPDPYPVEDCYAGLTWIAENAEALGVDPDRIAIVGSSSGANLATGVALLTRDRRGPQLWAQILMSPALDDRADSLSNRQFEGTGTVDRAANVFFWTALLGDRRGGEDVSIYAAPARATDLRGLPQAYLDCGSAEPFRDETVDYASALWAAGVQAELHVWPGAFHGFETMDPDAAVSRAQRRALADWTARLITPARGQ